MSKKLWLSLFEGIYKGKDNYDREQVISLYLDITGDITIDMTLEMFLELNKNIEICLSLNKKDIKKFMIVKKFRNFMNKYLKLKKIINSNLFNIFMIIVVLVNSITMLYSTIKINNDEGRNKNKSLDNTLQTIDKYCTYIYLVEFIIKICSLGIYKYFKDGWNTFDFILLILSLSNNIFEFIFISSKVQSTRILKLSRLQKLLKLTKNFKNVKFLKIIKIIFSVLLRVKNMFMLILLCLQSIINSFMLIFIIYYIYSIIGIILFNKKKIIIKENNIYKYEGIGNFENLSYSFLILFQIMLGKKWSSIMFNYMEKFNYGSLTFIYFFSFYFLVKMIILSLFLGLVWEIFGIEEKGMKDFMNKTLFKNLKYHTELFKKYGIKYVSSINNDENMLLYEDAYFKYLCSNKISIINSDIEEDEDIENSDNLDTDEENEPLKMPKEYKIKLFFEIEKECNDKHSKVYKENSDDFSIKSNNSDIKDDNEDDNIRFKRLINDKNINFMNAKKLKVNSIFMTDNYNTLNNIIFNTKKITNQNISSCDEVSSLNIYSESNSENSNSLYFDDENNQINNNNDILYIIIYLRRRIGLFNKAIQKYKENINNKVLNKLIPSLLMEEKFQRYTNFKNIVKNKIFKDKNLIQINNSLDSIDEYKIENENDIRNFLNNSKKKSYINQCKLEKKYNGIIWRTEVKINDFEILDFTDSYKEKLEEEYFNKNIGPIYNKHLKKYDPLSIDNFNLQSNMINLLTTILTSEDIQDEYFINALINIENILNLKFLKSKSIAKFVINNKTKNNFIINNKENNQNLKFQLSKINNNILVNIFSNCLIESKINYGLNVFNNPLIVSLSHDMLYNMIFNSNKEMFNFNLKESIWSFMGFKLIAQKHKNNLNKMFTNLRTGNEDYFEVKELVLVIFESVHSIKRDDIDKKKDKNDINKMKKNNYEYEKQRIKSLYEINLFLNDILKLLDIHKIRIFQCLSSFFSRTKHN